MLNRFLFPTLVLAVGTTGAALGTLLVSVVVPVGLGVIGFSAAGPFVSRFRIVWFYSIPVLYEKIAIKSSAIRRVVRPQMENRVPMEAQLWMELDGDPSVGAGVPR